MPRLIHTTIVLVYDQMELSKITGIIVLAPALEEYKDNVATILWMMAKEDQVEETKKYDDNKKKG